MAKVKIERGFGIIPNELIYDPKISLSAKWLYGFIHAKPDDWDFSVERIANECKESINTIRAYMKELEKNWWLERRKFKNDKWQWDVEYSLFAKPKTENHHQKTTHGELVAEDEEKTENHHQKTVDGKLANNKINNKKYNNISKDILLQQADENSLNFSSYQEIEISETTETTETEKEKSSAKKEKVATAEIVKAEYGDKEINEIIAAITDVHGTCDGTATEQRRFWYLLKNKISKIQWFDGDFYKFIRFICENSSMYNVAKTSSPKHIYYNLTALISAIKKEFSQAQNHNHNLPKNRIW